MFLKLKNKGCQDNAGSTIESDVFNIAIVILDSEPGKIPSAFISALQQPGHQWPAGSSLQARPRISPSGETDQPPFDPVCGSKRGKLSSPQHSHSSASERAPSQWRLLHDPVRLMCS